MAFGPLGFGPHEMDKLGTLTVGELCDMYDGWIWRSERERQDDLAYTFLLLKAWGAKKLKFEQLLGRPTYPILRSVQSKPTIISGEGEVIDGRTREEKLAELAELKEIFKEQLNNPEKAQSIGDDDVSELLEEAGIDPESNERQ